MRPEKRDAKGEESNDQNEGKTPLSKWHLSSQVADDQPAKWIAQPIKQITRNHMIKTLETYQRSVRRVEDVIVEGKNRVAELVPEMRRPEAAGEHTTERSACAKPEQITE